MWYSVMSIYNIIYNTFYNTLLQLAVTPQTDRSEVDSFSSTYLTLLMIMHNSDENNSSYGIKDYLFIYTFQPYVIRYHKILTISQYLQSAPYTSVEFVIASLKCAISNKCYYRQLFVFSITENIILVEITRTNGTGLLNEPMKA